jgi:FKBP-type peptidyl-prolyl cis-trans isomerase
MMNRIKLIALVLLLWAQLACQNSAGEAASVPAATPSATATPASGPGEMKTTTAGLKYQDIVIGTGRRPMLGQSVTVKYVGKLESGEVFEEGKFEFKLGAPDVLKGFNLGIAGGEGIDAMKLDGKRLVIMPPDLAYGKEGSPPKIAPHATLAFEIELVKIQGGMGF